MTVTTDGTAVPNTTVKEDIRLTQKVILYAFNYEHEFVLKAFAHTGLADHFQSKFSGYYDKYGNGETAFIHLWQAMTPDHRLTLANYIDNTFKG